MAQSTLLRSCQAHHLTYIYSCVGLVLWAVKQYLSTFFPSNWQLLFLTQQKGENDCSNNFMINFHKSCGQAGTWACDHWICSQICFWLLYRTQQNKKATSSLHPIPFPITKTPLFKYIEIFTSKNWIFSDKKKTLIFFKFLIKT